MYSEQYFPQIVAIEITNACNMRCLHCGSSSGKCRQDEMSTSELKALIDELIGLKADSFALTGGEPLMRRDWAELTKHIRSYEARCCLVSNGYFITPKVLETCLEVGLNGFGISLDGLEETHDKIRRLPGAWRRTSEALRLIRERQCFTLGITTTLSKLNVHELEGIYDHVCSIGCNQWRVQLANGVGRMSEHKDQFFDDTEYESLVDRILALKKDSPFDVMVANNIGYFGNKGTALRGDVPFAGDYCGIRGCGITANGNVKGDLSMPEEFVEGNIRESSFTEIWESDETFSYNRKFNMDMVGGFCRECRYLRLCRGGDAVSSFAANGIRANSPYCMYRIEHARGETPVDSEMTKYLLNHLGNQTTAASVANCKG